MPSGNNPHNKPVDVVAGMGLFMTPCDNWDHMQYQLAIDDVYLRTWFQEQIMQGAVERAELEHKISILEARLEALEKRR